MKLNSFKPIEIIEIIEKMDEKPYKTADGKEGISPAKLKVRAQMEVELDSLVLDLKPGHYLASTTTNQYGVTKITSIFSPSDLAKFLKQTQNKKEQ